MHDLHALRDHADREVARELHNIESHDPVGADLPHLGADQVVPGAEREQQHVVAGGQLEAVGAPKSCLHGTARRPHDAQQLPGEVPLRELHLERRGVHALDRGRDARPLAHHAQAFEVGAPVGEPHAARAVGLGHVEHEARKALHEPEGHADALERVLEVVDDLDLARPHRCDLDHEVTVEPRLGQEQPDRVVLAREHEAATAPLRKSRAPALVGGHVLGPTLDPVGEGDPAREVHLRVHVTELGLGDVQHLGTRDRRAGVGPAHLEPWTPPGRGLGLLRVQSLRVGRGGLDVGRGRVARDRRAFGGGHGIGSLELGVRRRGRRARGVRGGRVVRGRPLAAQRPPREACGREHEGEDERG